MNDTKDVSLEADRIEELFEAPLPSQPVVMIEYRNRGVPWGLVGPVFMLVAIAGAFAFYKYSVAERIRAQYSKTVYLEQVRVAEQAAAAKSAAAGATTGPLAAGMVDDTVFQVAGPAEVAAAETAKGSGSPPADAAKPATVAVAEKASASATTGADEPSQPNVRTKSKSPFDTDDESPASGGAGGDSVVGAGGAAAKNAPKESKDGKLASSPKEARGVDNAAASTVADAGPKAQESPTDPSSGAVVASAPGVNDGQPATPAVEPLPSSDEFLNQTAQESVRKENELAEERQAQVARVRAAMNEERVKFHDELRQILESQGKRSGEEIDELVSRSGKLMDQRTAILARGKWRKLGLSQPAKVNELRAFDVPEAAILNFISDNFYARMRSPGGPRDNNEVRVRAARVLLSCPITGTKDSPEMQPNAPNDLNLRGAGGAGPK